MTDKSQKFASSLREEAKEQGSKDSLAELIGAGTRPEMEETLKTPITAEAAEGSEPAEREKREFSAEQAEGLLSTLRSRFDKADKKLRKVINWTAIEKSLRASPEKLYALQKLEETGGEPQLVGIEQDELIFEDRSAESPIGRRNLDFDESQAQADEFGVEMQAPEAYKRMQKTGRFDLQSWSWLKTDPKYREGTGIALYGYRSADVTFVRGRNAGNRNPDIGWRASLRVKKA